MFTGLIQDIGEVVVAEKTGRDMRLAIAPRRLNPGTFPIGASIACSGVCLTVTEKNSKHFVVEVSGETLDKTTVSEWQVGGLINLEPSLKMGDELGGHLVYGHVDGIGKCLEAVADGQGMRFVFEIPAEIAPFVAAKGSVTINGVSLTVNEVTNNRFGVMIIPHTAKETTFGGLKAGMRVNIEIDMLARYIARMNEFKKQCA